MSAALDTLRALADRSTAGRATATRRPTWAPPLVLDGELVQLLRDLAWLTATDVPVARLWARFTSPKRGQPACIGFELRAGTTRKGQKIFETMLFDKWRSGPIWREPNEKSSPRWVQRYPLAVRAVELSAQRVAAFAGNPQEEMKLGGILARICADCGKALTDPISLEMGIGPECRRSSRGAA